MLRGEDGSSSGQKERLESHPLLFTLSYFSIIRYDKGRHVRLARFSLGLGGSCPGRASMGEALLSKGRASEKKLCSACSNFVRCMLQSTVLVCDNASSSIDPDAKGNFVPVSRRPPKFLSLMTWNLAEVVLGVVKEGKER